jgi:acetylornithine/N-succinyldiaminopimelate aminotransferase
MDQVFLCNSGAEANDAAIKLARKWAQRNRPGAFEIITTDQSFHGRTLATVAASGKPGWQQAFPPNLPGFVKVPFGDVMAVEQHISARTCALMVEPIQGEAGVVVPPLGYLKELRQLCDVRGVLLILDEVQTGCGRTGTFLRAEAEAVRADILTLGKGLGGGVPIAALLARGGASCFELGDHGGTYAGNPLTAACALEVLQHVSSADFLRQVRERGELLRAELLRLAHATASADLQVTGARGAGLLWAIELGSDVAARVAEQCFRLGLLVNAPRPNLLRLMPQLRVEPSEITRAAQLLGEALERTARIPPER